MRECEQLHYIRGKMMNRYMKDVILISGRVGAGKSLMVIFYANMFASTTLFISNENTKEELCGKGLNQNVIVKDAININITTFDFSHFDTVILDFIQVFDYEWLEMLVDKLIKMDKRVIAIDQMKRDGSVYKNIFESC